jgi:hypothetical protein
MNEPGGSSQNISNGCMTTMETCSHRRRIYMERKWQEHHLKRFAYPKDLLL